MKKLIVMAAALLAALFIVGCASTGGPVASDLMSNAKGDAPDGTLVGQATAGSVQQAEQRAKLQLVKGLAYIAKELIDEQVASGRLSNSVSSDFQTYVNTALTNSSLSSAVKVGSGTDTTKEKKAWAVYYLERGDALKEVNAAVTAAKKEVAAGNFNTDNFNAKFAAAISREWKN